MKKAYDKRSNLAHGEEEKGIDYGLLFEVRNIVRKSLKIFIKNPKLRDKLDEIILKNGVYETNS